MWGHCLSGSRRNHCGHARVGLRSGGSGPAMAEGEDSGSGGSREHVGRPGGPGPIKPGEERTRTNEPGPNNVVQARAKV